MRPRGKARRPRALAVALAGWVLATSAGARTVSGVELPGQIHVAGRRLRLNGAAVQQTFIFRTYVVGLYLESPARSAVQAIGSDQVKRLHVHMLRNASGEQVIRALRDGLRNNGVDTRALGPRLDQLLAAVSDMRAGDAISITYVPGEGTSLRSHRGASVTIPGKDFAEAIFSIWLGRNGELAGVSRGLLGR